VTTEPVKIIECPRDAWQGMPQYIPAEVKADYLRALIRAGFTHIDAVSFVSPAAVPQMADSERVLALLGPVSAVEMIAIVVNQQGAERAIAAGTVSTLGFPYSLSATFLERNQRQTLLQARQTLERISAQAMGAGLGMVAYLSMAFGNPYGDPWQQEDVITACHTLKELGLTEISLADTVGMATPAQIRSLLDAVLEEVPGIELGAHLHASPQQAPEKVAAAYQAGCRRLDMALGGQGGCPFAQDALVGNIATEKVVDALTARGAALPPLKPLDVLLRATTEIGARYGNSTAAD
jgi:hydroxymethylglutaryl-CoA lyase